MLTIIGTLTLMFLTVATIVQDLSTEDINSHLHDLVRNVDEKIGKQLEAKPEDVEKKQSNQATFLDFDKEKRWVALARKQKRAAVTAMSPDEMRCVAGLLVIYTAILFLLYPFVCINLCLMVNVLTFCGQPRGGSYPGDLAYMLLVMVPGYLLWNLLVVLWWANVLAVVLGREKEKEEKDYLSPLQQQVAFCVQPVLMIAFWMVAWVYRMVVRKITNEMIRTVEDMMGRSQGDGRQAGRINVDGKQS